MPSGKTHDAITFLLTVPAALAVYACTHDGTITALSGAFFVFGGIMFGPDLDTASKQYSRWGIFRFVWFPYKSVFRHRSRLTHGLALGALIRVVYFFGVVTFAAFGALALFVAATGGEIPGLINFSKAWHDIGGFAGDLFGMDGMAAIFFGTWLGAASHTVTDLTVSYIKTGRRGELF